MKEGMTDKTCFDIEGFYRAKCCGTCEFGFEHDYGEDEIRELEETGVVLTEFERYQLKQFFFDRHCDKHDCRTITTGCCSEWEED